MATNQPVGAQPASHYYELYRRSTLGLALTDTLDELISSGQITPQLGMKVLCQFDKAITEALQSRVRSKATIRGHLHTYRFCDDVWTFIIENAVFRIDGGDLTSVDKVKIVACNASRPI